MERKLIVVVASASKKVWLRPQRSANQPHR
jgi:hypothetical protein